MGDLLSPSSRQSSPERSSLPTILIATVATLFVAYLTKQACFAIGIGDTFYCHSDYGALYYGRELAGGRFPYLPPALEYPSGLGLILWLASAITSTGVGFARASMVFVAIACFVISSLLWRHVGQRALLFAAAPSVALYAFINWDLVAVVFGVAAVVAFVHRRDVPAGALLGIGAAIKVFPALLLVPLLADRWREHDAPAAWRILAAAAVPVLLLNAPVAWVSFDGWAHFLRFNSTRPVDWGTLWSAGCQTFGLSFCANVPLVNTLALAAFLAGSTLAWVLVTRAAPHIPRWQLGFPLIVIFFLTNKVYSPQYSLWILPWFPLVLPSVPLFLAYEAVDIGIYVTSFAWQQHLAGPGGLPLWPLHVVLLVRAVLLMVMLIAFTRRAASTM